MKPHHNCSLATAHLLKSIFREKESHEMCERSKYVDRDTEQMLICLCNLLSFFSSTNHYDSFQKKMM